MHLYVLLILLLFLYACSASLWHSLKFLWISWLFLWVKMEDSKEQWPKKVHNTNQKFMEDYAKMWPYLRKGNYQFVTFCSVCWPEFTVVLIKSSFFSLNILEPIWWNFINFNVRNMHHKKVSCINSDAVKKNVAIAFFFLWGILVPHHTMYGEL